MCVFVRCITSIEAMLSPIAATPTIHPFPPTPQTTSSSPLFAFRIIILHIYIEYRYIYCSYISLQMFSPNETKLQNQYIEYYIYVLYIIFHCTKNFMNNIKRRIPLFVLISIYCTVRTSWLWNATKPIKCRDIKY